MSKHPQRHPLAMALPIFFAVLLTLPADYVQYPDLSWFQPAFPRAKTRHALEKAGPLTLQYRFWIRQGAAPAEKELRNQHQIYQKRQEP